jgi:hypothetical protein
MTTARPSYPGHPDDWPDGQWEHYRAWRDAEQRRVNARRDLALARARRAATSAERIESKRGSTITSRLLRRRQREHEAVAAENDRHVL